MKTNLGFPVAVHVDKSRQLQTVEVLLQLSRYMKESEDTFVANVTPTSITEQMRASVDMVFDAIASAYVEPDELLQAFVIKAFVNYVVHNPERFAKDPVAVMLDVIEEARNGMDEVAQRTCEACGVTVEQVRNGMESDEVIEAMSDGVDETRH